MSAKYFELLVIVAEIIFSFCGIASKTYFCVRGIVVFVIIIRFLASMKTNESSASNDHKISVSIQNVSRTDMHVFGFIFIEDTSALLE